MKRFLSIENLTVLGIILGILFGVYFKETALLIKPLGDAFLSGLKMITIPLIFASVFVSIASLSSIKEIKDMGIKAILYYFSTTALAVATGIVIVNLIHFSPPEGLNLSSENVHIHKEFTIESLIQSFIPSNIFQSFSQGKVLHVIVFSILFAIAVLTLKQEKKDVITRFFDGINDSMLTIAKWIINLSPLGVFALVSYIVAERGLSSLLSLWQYALAVVIGLLVHAVVNLGLIAFLIGRFNPFTYFKKVKEALLIAFSTSSSSATLPVSMEVAEEKAKVKKKVAGFVLPLGATINMDGTALYEAIAAMFVASFYGIDLSIGEQIVIFFTASLAAIGAAGIPSAGLVTMTLVFTAVGIPLEGIALILSVDRFLDMLRTTVNVWGDLIGAKIIDRFVKN